MLSSLGTGQKYKILVCRGPSCGDRRGSAQLREEFVQLLDKQQLTDSVELGWQSCFGRCTKGPNILVMERGEEKSSGHRFVLAVPPPSRGKRVSMYTHVALNDISEIVTEHLQNRRPVRRLLERFDDDETGASRPDKRINTDIDGD